MSKTENTERAAWILSTPIGESKIMFFSTRKESWDFYRAHEEGDTGIEVGFPSLTADKDGFRTVQYRRTF